MKEDLGIISIATNKYIDYWKDMVRSSESIVQDDFEITYYVFTDKPEEVFEFCRDTNIRVECFQISSLGWPEATLLRFNLINQESFKLNNKYLMYLDADMLFKNKFDSSLLHKLKKNTMVLVQHPGYYRPSKIQLFSFYRRYPYRFLIDLASLIRVGGLGSWETNKKSSAYVSRGNRKRYFCGGIWAGSNSSFKSLCRELELSVKFDLENNFMATWHDESHLNSWATKNQLEFLTPSYCYDPSYEQLSGLQEIVRAVDKGNLKD